MATPEQIQRIAAAANCLRPDWPVKSLVTHLTEHHATRPYRDLAAALAYVAADSATVNPARLRENGPWWVIGEAREKTPDQPHPTCPDHPGQDPAACPQCRPVLYPATPDRVRALKAAIIRTTPTSPRPTLTQLENARRTR